MYASICPEVRLVKNLGLSEAQVISVMGERLQGVGRSTGQGREEDLSQFRSFFSSSKWGSLPYDHQITARLQLMNSKGSMPHERMNQGIAVYSALLKNELTHRIQNHSEVGTCSFERTERKGTKLWCILVM